MKIPNKTVSRALLASALSLAVTHAFASPEYHVVVTKIGFPAASSGNQGGANGGASAGGGAGSGGSNAGSGGSQPAPASCTLPWGGTLASGQSTKAYSQSATTYPTTCEALAVNETCTNGSLSAPSASQSCVMAPTVTLTSATLPGVKDHAPYSYDFGPLLQLGDTSVSGTVTWSVASGSLPAGLSLSSTGVLSGTPTSPSTVAFTLQATYKGVNGQQTYHLAVGAADCALPWGVTLASGQTAQAYSQSAVTYPTTCESVAVTESCSDGTLSAPTASQACAMAPTVALAASTLPSVTDNTGYSHDFSQNLTIGDTTVNSPVTWSVAGGTLPDGLSLNTTTGVVSGKPTAPGTANFTLQASYKGITAQQAYQLTVAASACTLPWGTTLASGQSVQAYSQSAVTYPATCGSVAVTESCNDGSLSVPSASQACAVTPTVTLNADSGVSAATAGTAYSYNFGNDLSVGDTSVAAGSVSWSVVSGALPAGMTLNNSTGVVSGTSSTVGTATFTLRASYKGITAQQAYSITVGGASCTLPWGGTLGSGQSTQAYSQSAVTYPTTCSSVAVTESCNNGTLSAPSASQACAVTPTLTLASATLPAGIQGYEYAGYDLKSLVTIGDTGNPSTSTVTWSVISGALPAGVTLNADGTISGKPTATGTSNFTVKATYKSTNGQTAYQLVVAQLTVSLKTDTLPAGQVGQNYSFDFKKDVSVSGDSTFTPSGITWTQAGGTIPAGLVLGPDGVLTGKPTAKSPYLQDFAIQATYRDKTAVQSYAIPSVAGIDITNYGTYRGWADGTYATSCLGYVNGDSAHGATASQLVDGVYRIATNKEVAGYTTTYCDMTNGGWTMVMQGTAGYLGTATATDGTAWYNATGDFNLMASPNPATNATWKYADALINAVPKTVYKLVTTGGYSGIYYVNGTCTYAHTTAASGTCAVTYSNESLTTKVATGTSANGISDNTGNGYHVFTNNSSGYKSFGWCGGNGLPAGGGCGFYGSKTNLAVWVK